MPTISMNAFPLGMYMRHYGLQSDLMSKFLLVKASGGDTLEMGVGAPDQVEEVARLYEQFRMESKVCVLGANLFQAGWEAGVEKVITTAEAFHDRLGTPMVNMCLDRKTDETGKVALVKTDEELTLQGEAYKQLIQELESAGLQVCFHMHDPELFEDWKEIKAMVAINPGMGFCMDVQWIHQGSGFSMEAVNKFLEDYGPQIVHLHLRQSAGNELQDTFRLEGDIDYRHVFRRLREIGYTGDVSLEQLRFDDTPENVRPFALTASEGLEQIRLGWSEAGLS